MSTIAVLLALSLQAKDPDVATVTLDLTDVSLSKVFEIITKETGIPIEVDAELKKELDKELLSIKVNKIVVTGAVRLLVVPRGLELKVVDKKKILIVRPKDK